MASVDGGTGDFDAGLRAAPYEDLEFDPAPTVSSRVQMECEDSCRTLYQAFLQLLQPGFDDEMVARMQQTGWISEKREIRLMREKHVRYLLAGLESLPGGYASLDASRPWICYWIVHSLSLLGVSLADPEHAELGDRVVATMAKCRSGGGFGGGPGQYPHLATTYAAVLALCTIGTPRAYAAIDRAALYRWYLSLKDAGSGGFRMHADGEVDVRGTFTVVCVAKLLNMLTPELAAGVAAYTAACQTFEGGFGGEPGNEAHGGYVFCAFASLVLLQARDSCDLERLQLWLAHRQMGAEGGFQGRCNKLVDGCYSFWQGGAAGLLGRDWLEDGRVGLWDDAYWSCAEGRAPEPDAANPWVQRDLRVDGAGAAPPEPLGADAGAGGAAPMNRWRLQQYILICGQHRSGGLRDKPEVNPDYYHTCYCLSGLSAAQWADGASARPLVFGDAANALMPTNPVYNIRERCARDAAARFRREPCDHAALSGAA